MVGAVAALHHLYRGGDGAAGLISWAGLLLLGMTALGGGMKLAMWGARPVTSVVSDEAKARLSDPVLAVVAAAAVIAGALGMWWTFRGGYASWWQHLTGESQWSLLLGVGQMLVAVIGGAALFTGGKYLTGLTKEVLIDAGVLLERDRTSGSGGAAEGVWHPGLVAALIGGGLGLVLLTAGITPRLYVWITGPDVLPAVGAITFVLLWAIGSNLGWWKGLAGLYTWATDVSQKAGVVAGVVAVLMFSAGGLGLGWFTPATVPVARAACPPDCGGPGGSDGPPGGGQMFQPPSQGGPQMPDYQGGINQPPMDQNGSISIYNTQAPSISNNGVNGSSGQQGPQQGWDQPAHGSQIPDYQNATPYTQGPGRPNPDYDGGQTNPGTNAGSQGGQPNQGIQQPAQQPQQPPQQQNTGEQPDQQPQQSDQQKIDDLTRQLQEKQQQSSQDRQRIDDMTKQLQQNKQNQKQQQSPKLPSKDKKKDDKDEQDDRDKQSGDNDLAALLMGAASTRRRKQDEQEQGPDTQALGQDASQAVQGLPGDVQTYVQSGQQIGQSSGQAAQGFGSAAQAGASLASSAQSGAVNPQDAITLVQGVSQGIQGTADAVNAGSQIVKTGQKEADQVAQAVGDANPQLKPQTEQFTQLNDTVSKGTEGVGQVASGVSQVSGVVNSVSSMGTSGAPDTVELAGDSGESPGLAELQRLTDQAVVDRMQAVNAAQRAIGESASDAYTHGAGYTSPTSPEELNQNLASALDNLGQVPDYSQVDPNAVSPSENGSIFFSYSNNGVTQQVYGSLSNGNGEIFDQGTQSYYTFKDGALSGIRTLPSGQATAVVEPLFTAITTATGVGPALKGAQGAWLGFRALFARESTAALSGVAADTVIPRAVQLAGSRATAAEERLAGSIKNVNPSGSDTNCVYSVITVDQILDGAKVSAMTTKPLPISFLEGHFGAKFMSAAGEADITQKMLAAGNGARGVVFGSRGPGQVGHVFNVVNQGGTVRFLDGQIGKAASFDGYKTFQFMRYR